jgi:hypothetical protein
MDPRNLDARDLVEPEPVPTSPFPPGLGAVTHLDPLELQPAVVPPPPPPPAPDPELPTTRAELRNLIRVEVVKIIANSEQIKVLLAMVPRGEA